MKNFVTGEVLTESDLDIYCVNTIFARKTATETVNNSASFQSDDHLTLTLAANSDYEMGGLLSTDGPATTDIKLSWIGPAGASVLLQVVGPTISAVDGGDVQSYLFENFGDSPSFGTLGTGDHRPIGFKGIVRISSTAGDVTLRWAQNSAAAFDTRILVNSYMWARRIS